MTPEVQAYIDHKFDVNYLNQWAMVSALVAIFVSKLLIWRQTLRILREQERQRHTQEDTSHKQDETNLKLDEGTATLTRKVDTIPDQVVRKMSDSGGQTPDPFPKPPLPPP